MLVPHYFRLELFNYLLLAHRPKAIELDVCELIVSLQMNEKIAGI